MPLKMKELPEGERPYEKLQMYGPKKLSNAELLAIIIKTGTKEETSLDLANRVLLLAENINKLQNIAVSDLKKIKGIGTVKALQIQAICELANRINLPVNNLNMQIKSTKDVANLLMNELRHKKCEIIKVIILNTKNKITQILDLKEGDTKEVRIEPVQIMQEIIKVAASKFIIVHNHPSGDSSPSMADIEFTKRIKECSNILGVNFLDHVILGDGNYKSILNYREEEFV